MDTYEVLAATATTTGSGTPIWMVSMRKPDGQIHCHAFPPSAIEWRMAEYGFNSEEALDCVLHEPWAADPQDPVKAKDDPAVLQGMVVRAAGPVVDWEPIRLHNADTIADARAAHRIRIADAKTRVHILPPKGKADPLDVIRQQNGVTEDGLREKAARVDAARRSVRGQAVPGGPSVRALQAAEATAKEMLRA